MKRAMIEMVLDSCAIGKPSQFSADADAIDMKRNLPSLLLA